MDSRHLDNTYTLLHAALLSKTVKIYASCQDCARYEIQINQYSYKRFITSSNPLLKLNSATHKLQTACNKNRIDL